MKEKGTKAGGSLNEGVVNIARTLDAPRGMVFKAWTSPEHLTRWFGPTGFTLPVCKMDFRPGGYCHYCMRSPDGKDYWGKSVYAEIVTPERIVMSDQFSDEQGDLARNPDQPDWPPEGTIDITLAEKGGKTELKIRHAFRINSPAEQKAFDEGADMCSDGWNQTLDRLEEYLAQ